LTLLSERWGSLCTANDEPLEVAGHAVDFARFIRFARPAFGGMGLLYRHVLGELRVILTGTPGFSHRGILFEE